MTSEGGHKPKALNEKGVRKVLDAALSDKGYYIESFSFHARFDHPERRISIDDVLFGLRNPWRGCKVDEFNDDEWQWQYLIKTHDVDGNEIVVSIGLDPKNAKFTIVTAFYDE
jgi:hypothetical protein